MQVPLAISTKDKTEDWAKQCIDAYLGYGISNTSTNNILEDIVKYYNAYNGALEDNLFNKTTNPFNSQNAAYTRFPTEIRQYNIIKPLVDKLVGEYLDRPRRFSVNIVNSDVESKYKKAEHQKIKDYFTKLVANEQAKLAGEDMPYANMQSPQEVRKELANWNDERAIAAQQALDLLIQEVKLEEKIHDLIFHYIISGYTFTYRDIINNEVHWAVKNPLRMAFRSDEETKFIEDTEVQIYRSNKTYAQVIESFGDLLTEEEANELYENYVNGGSYSEIPFVVNTDSNNINNALNTNYSSKGTNTALPNILVSHVVWRTPCKKGKITTINEDGIEEYTYVDESYKPLKTDDIQWGIYMELWEGYKLSKDIYKGMQRLPVVMEAVDNPTSIKSLYNGISYSNINTYNKSIVSMAIPYQVFYSIMKYNIELTIAKNLGKLVIIPVDAIPDAAGWSEEKVLYYARAAGYLFVGSNNGGNQFASLDADVLGYVEKQMMIARQVRNELHELFGFNDVRLGQQSADYGRDMSRDISNTSSLISEHIFRKVDEVLIRDLTVLLHYSKFAWRNGKKGMMNVSDNQRVYYTINPDDYSDVSFGINISNSAREKQNLEQLKAIAEAFANNNGNPSMIAEVLSSNNMATLKVKLKEFEANLQEQKQRENEQAQKATQQVVDTQLQQQREKMAADAEMNTQRIDADITIALIKEYGKQEATANTGTQDTNTATSSSPIQQDYISLLDLNLEALTASKEQQLKKKELDIKEKDSDNKVKIANLNKNKYDAK